MKSVTFRIAAFLVINADGRDEGRAFTSVCLSVCLFICTISQQRLQLLNHHNLDTEMVHCESWKFIYLFWGQKIKGHAAHKKTVLACFALL